MNRLSSLLVMLIVSMAITAQTDISLDGEWQLTMAGKDYTVNVPHTYNLMAGYEDYAGEATYTRPLPVTADQKGKTVRICFDAVYHDATVFVNGKKAGEHIGKGYTPFSFDISRLLKYDGRDKLKVIVNNAYSDRMLPYKRKFDWNNDGGIIRSVRLHLSGRQTIRYVHVVPKTMGTVALKLRLWQDNKTKACGQLVVTDRQTGACVYDKAISFTKKKGDREFMASFDIASPKLWDIDHPNLYDFTFTLYNQTNNQPNKQPSDKITDHFGFRDFKVNSLPTSKGVSGSLPTGEGGGRGFLLNGEPVRLPGIEAMPGSHPDYGMAEPQAVITQTADLMRGLGTCITRFHWQQDNRMLDAMDERGILVTEQIPWWQQPSPALGEELRQNAKEQLEEMIEAHFNHPCIFAWGISNEVWGIHDDLRYLGSFVSQIDPDRLRIDCTNKIWSDLEKSSCLVLDIPTWNEYTGTWHGNNREDLPGRLDNIDRIIPDRPLLITEAGLCEPAFTGGDARRIDEMFYHIHEWQKRDFIPGYIYFCLQDYRTQMGEEGYGKNRIRRHGVTTTDFKLKPSYHVLRQIMSPIDITEVMPANSAKTGDALAGQIEVNATDHDARVVITVRNSIPSYTLRGYTLRFNNADGKEQTVTLPEMKPGTSHPVVLRNINDRYAFSIFRPDGTCVMTY